MNCLVVPFAMLGLAGVTAIDTSAAAVIVSVVDPDTLPNSAVIVTAPGEIAVVKPADPVVLLIAAKLMSEDIQATSAVRSCVELSV